MQFMCKIWEVSGVVLDEKGLVATIMCVSPTQEDSHTKSHKLVRDT